MLFDKNIFLFLIFPHIINYLQEIYLVCSYFFPFSPGAVCFFVKHVQTKMCINDTRILQAGGTWGNLSFVELSNNCLDPAAQFRFLDNSAMLNLERRGCFEGTARGGTGHLLPALYLLVATNPIYNCRDESQTITQTSWGGLYAYYLPTRGTLCVVPGKDDRLATNQGIDPYIALTTDCTDAENKRFNFGKFL
jgi:hypothetical protein